jgi:hypothetical protein
MEFIVASLRRDDGRFRTGFLLLVAVIFLLATGAYGAGARLEADDAFCASCHVEPENRYYRQSVSPGQPPTLAAFHAGKQVRCIDCHSGRWIPGRLRAQWLGLQNLLAFRAGKHKRPAQTTRPVGDIGCSKCHGDLSWVSERPGHYHSPVLRREWQARGGPANTCEACHPSHQAFNPDEAGLVDEAEVEGQCEACHDRFE